MTEKIAIKELQSLEEESGLVILYEIALDEDGSSRAYFTRGEDTDLTNIQMYDYDNNSQLNTYDAIPVEAEGFEHWFDGKISPHPRKDLAELFDSYYNEALEKGYQLDDYRIEPFGRFPKKTQQNYSGNTVTRPKSSKSLLSRIFKR